MTGRYFATLGVRLTVGRSFTREEEQPGSRAAVVVLSSSCWQRLGAGRGRMVAQLMTEGLVIALAGGLLGLALSVWVLHAALASLRPIVEQSLTADITPDWRVWLTSLACAMLAALAVAVGPAWRMSRLDLLPGIKGWEGGGAGRGRLGGRS